MGILSYKQYKLLHENLDSVIGISRPTNVGIQSEAPQLFGMMSKMAKRMPGDVPPGLKKKPGAEGPAADIDADMGDEDMGDEDHPHDDAGEDMGDEDMGDEDHPHDDEDMGDEEGNGDEDMGDEEGGDMGDMGDMGPMGAGSPPPGMGGPMAGGEMGGPLGGPPMGKKKPMPPKMMARKYMKKEASDPQDAKMKAQNKKNNACDQDDAGSGTAQKKTTIKKEAADPQDAKMKAQNKKNDAEDSCCSKCGNMMDKKCCKMTKEEQEFNDSLIRQTGSLKFAQDEDGYWVPVKEDVLIQQEKPEATETEPQAGEVGFAPQAKIGILGSSFTEWASRHQQSIKKK